MCVRPGEGQWDTHERRLVDGGDGIHADHAAVATTAPGVSRRRGGKMTTRLWLVFEHGKPVVFHGLFKRKRDAEQAYRTERENLRGRGNAVCAHRAAQP